MQPGCIEGSVSAATAYPKTVIRRLDVNVEGEREVRGVSVGVVVFRFGVICG